MGFVFSQPFAFSTASNISKKYPNKYWTNIRCKDMERCENCARMAHVGKCLTVTEPGTYKGRPIDNKHYQCLQNDCMWEDYDDE